MIGDVAGHGSEAASVMGQVRMAVRAFSLEGHPPATTVRLVHDLIRSLYDGEQMVTMLFIAVGPIDDVGGHDRERRASAATRPR